MSEISQSPETLLIIEDDDIVLRLLKLNLERCGYNLLLARTGNDGLALARQMPPALVLSDSRLPDMDGLSICQQMIADKLTRHIPVIIMSGRRDSRDIAAALEAGADDYVFKPLDFVELVARVRAHIRRAKLKPALNPLTSLPSNLIIEQEIRQLTAPGHGFFAVLYIDLNHFKAYNDVYGFPAGDEAIRLLARVITTAAAELSQPMDFVGHVGGDDFVVITVPERSDILAQRIRTDFERLSPELYNPIDRRRGYLTAKDRQGMIKKFPLLSVTIAIVHNQYRPITSHWEIGEIGAELKQFAKSRGVNIWKDQRRG